MTLRTEQRVDRGTLVPARRRHDGSLLVEGHPVKEGVLVYRRNGQTIRELVPAQTLADSAGGLARSPVTLEHPTENGQVVPVTPHNVQRYQVGDTDGNVRVEEGGFVRVEFAIRRADAIDAVETKGWRELSALYDATIDPTPGVHPVYGPYDAVQVGRTYNSIAIVPRGRAGPQARLNADAAELVDPIERRADSITTAATPHTGERSMHSRWLPIFLALGITARADNDDQAAEAVNAALRVRADAAAADATKLAAEKARADTAEAKVKQLEAADAQRADSAERAELDQLATVMGLDPKAHADGKALRRAIATKRLGDLRADADDAYIRAVVDLAKADHAGQPGERSGREAGSAAFAPREHRADHDGSGRREHRSPSQASRARWGPQAEAK